MRLQGAGCLRPRGCLRSLAWECFQRADAGSRRPMPAAGLAAAPPRRRTPVRATEDLTPARGPGQDSPGLLRREALASLAGQEAHLAPTGRRASRGRLMAALATAGRKPAPRQPGPAAHGTAPRRRVTSSRVTRGIPRRRTARSPAARRQDSSTASTRSSGPRGRAARVPACRLPGFLAARARGTGLVLTAAVSRDPALASPSAQGRSQGQALPGRGPRRAERPGTRRLASSPARWGKDLGPGGNDPGRTIPARCRQGRSLRGRRRSRPGRCHPAMPPRACRSQTRQARASSPRLASSPGARSSPLAGQAPGGPARRGRVEGRSRQGQPASQAAGAAGRRLPTARQGTRGQGLLIWPTTILTGC